MRKRMIPSRDWELLSGPMKMKKGGTYEEHHFPVRQTSFFSILPLLSCFSAVRAGDIVPFFAEIRDQPFKDDTFLCRWFVERLWDGAGGRRRGEKGSEVPG